MAETRESLRVYLNTTLMGDLFRDRQGQLAFSYRPGYLSHGPGVPLSTSVPLTEGEHVDEKVSPFLWGLLPDDSQLLDRWAARFQVSRSNVFGLLREVGEDCAGALRFVREEREGELSTGGRDPLSTAQIEKRLAELKRDSSLGRSPADRGRFSLAGAQAKTALQKIGRKWYLPWGLEPTTHILKPPRPELDGHAENEHFCLRLATALGLSVAETEIAQFGAEMALVVKRYDRLETPTGTIRIHQEDMCQALSIHPARKYESEGGPGIPVIMDLLNQSSSPSEDRERFMEAILFNYLILGSDAHGKNYSILLGANRQIRLAPLYDLASLLPYASRPRERRVAMRIGTAYRDDQIRPSQFEHMARACEFPAARIHALLHDLLERMPTAARALVTELDRAGLRHPVIKELAGLITARCQKLSPLFPS